MKKATCAYCGQRRPRRTLEPRNHTNDATWCRDGDSCIRRRRAVMVPMARRAMDYIHMRHEYGLPLLRKVLADVKEELEAFQ